MTRIFVHFLIALGSVVVVGFIFSLGGRFMTRADRTWQRARRKKDDALYFHMSDDRHKPR